jgi:hypothetical protein
VLGRDCFNPQECAQITLSIQQDYHNQNRPYPDGIAFDEAWKQRQRADAMESSRDAWRNACRYIYDVIGEGGNRGRPLDIIGKSDYHKIIELIAIADQQEPEST